MIKFYLFLFSFSIITDTVLCQYCTAVGPSSNADSNLQSVSLSGESSTAIVYSGCPGVIGLDDQTLAQSVILNAGGNYTAYPQFGTCGGNYAGAAQGWIDFNQNQIFEPSETIGTWVGTPPTPMSTWNFTVPAGATSGNTRMRIVHFEGGSIPINPCATFVWGSTTDFTVQIGGGFDCSSYIGQNMTSPRVVSALPYSENHNNSVCYFNVLTVYNSPDVYYRILPAQLGAQFLTVSLCGSVMDTYLSILDANGNVIYYNDDNAGCGTSSKIHFNTGSHDTLYAVVQGWGTETGDYSILIEQELVSIDDNRNTPLKFEIYPNPATESFTLSTNETSGLILIHDISGKLVYSTQIESQLQIPVSDFLTGTYFVTMQAENGIYTEKLIVY